jgi:CDP-diacylglycerol--serine O-phosphatidyltransferase
VLMISSLATFSAASLRLRQRIRFEAVVVLVVIAAALVAAPWPALTVVALLYLATIPFSARAYRRIRRQPASGEEIPVPEPPGPDVPAT